MGNAIARRSLVLGVAAATIGAGSADAQLRTDTEPRVLNGNQSLNQTLTKVPGRLALAAVRL